MGEPQVVHLLLQFNFVAPLICYDAYLASG